MTKGGGLTKDAATGLPLLTREQAQAFLLWKANRGWGLASVQSGIAALNFAGETNHGANGLLTAFLKISKKQSVRERESERERAARRWRGLR